VVLTDALQIQKATQKRKKLIAHPQVQYVTRRILRNVDVPRILPMFQVAMP